MPNFALTLTSQETLSPSFWLSSAGRRKRGRFRCKQAPYRLTARPAFDFVCLKSQSGSPHLRSRMRNGFPRHSAACLHQDNMYVSSTHA